ncbi:MAG: P-loop NTPase, partial [Oscillospiraceae bacterium]
MKKINIITGHYGSGKTNISANMAIDLAKTGEKVTVVDLDIVNPYFRTADFTELFAEKNIELVKSMYANSNLDIPAISFDLERIATDDGYLIIDVGGDDDGATALGRYAEAFEPFKADIDFFYVVNLYRYITDETDEPVMLLRGIENASHMTATAIINNSNLGTETVAKTVLDAIPYAEEIAKKLSLPIAFTSA